MQTILGARGAIGRPLAAALATYTDKVRLVSRHPRKEKETDELFVANITNRAQVMKATQGSEIVYLTAGLEYKTSVWRKQWPIIMRNAIDACIAHNAKLVFFDNVYMYNKESIPHMTEDAPIDPSSKKGQVRAQLVNMLFEEVKAGRLTALIARSADFYGPQVKTSVLQETVYKNLKQGKKAMLLASAYKLHNYTYTPDAVNATALLGNTPDAYNQVWHLPTGRALTGKQWVELFAKELEVAPKYKVTPKWIIGLSGLFMPIMKEMYEMMYQYDRDYIFDSSKFEQRFGIKPTTPEEAVRSIVHAW